MFYLRIEQTSHIERCTPPGYLHETENEKRKIRLKRQMKKSLTESGCADSEHSAKEESTQLQSLFPESQVP